MNNLQKIFERFYGHLPLGVLILNSTFSKVAYFNKSYTTALDKSYHAALIEGCKKNRNKYLATVRFVPEDGGDVLLFDVVKSDIKVASKTFHLHLFINLKHREKMHKTAPRESYIFDKIRVNIPNQLVKFKGITVNFSATEFNLFAFLCKNEDRLFSKEKLLKEVWNKYATNTRTVDIYISRVKKRLRESGCDINYIKTMHGRGYMFQINS